MNKSKEQKGEERKNKNREERREGDEGAAQKETTYEAGRRKKVGTLPRTEASGARKKPHRNKAPWTGTTRQRSAKRTSARSLDWNIRGNTHPDWNIRGAEALAWNIGGRSGPGMERLGLQKEEEATTARKGKENMNESK